MKRKPIKRDRFSKQRKITRILSIIADHIWQRGYQPSLREVAKEMGWHSVGYVQKLLTDYFKEHSGGRKKTTSRAIDFNWRQYVTVSHVPWDDQQVHGQYPSPRSQAPRKAARKLGRLSK